METTPNPLRLSLSWTCLAFIAILFTHSSAFAQCDTEVSGVLTYCNAVGTPGTTGYFVGFRVKDLTGTTLNVVDLDGNNVTNRGKRINDITMEAEPATVTIAQLVITGTGADTLEYWYFGPYANGTTFNIALVDPTNTCDTIYIASGSYDCADNTGTSDPGACDNDVPLYFLDFSQTEFVYGGGAGGNEDFDEIFLIMQRSRESVCCDLAPANQRCFEFIVRLADQDIGLAIDDIGSGATAGQFYADTLNDFDCSGPPDETWPFTVAGGQSSDLPLCLNGAPGAEFIVLSCKSGANVTGASIDAISNIFAPAEATIEPCNVSLEVFNIDSAFWTSEDDPNLDNFLSCNPDSLFCTFFYDVAIFGEVTACEGDTFVYVVGGMPADNECLVADTILYDTTYVVVYPTFTVSIDTACLGDSLTMTAVINSPAVGCPYAFDWSNGASTQSITVPFSDTEYFVTVTRSDLAASSQECVLAVDSIIASGGATVSCENIADTLYTCINELPDPDTTLVSISGCADATPIIYTEDESNGGAGCIGDTLRITRLYIVDFDGDTITTTDDRDTCTQVLSFVDDVAPVITGGCPANITVSCDFQVPPPSPTAFTATDNCGGGASVTHGGDVVSDSTCANRYTITRTYVATDNCGNTSTCTQSIIVFDDSAPTVTCPMNVTVECANQVPLPNTSSVIATDSCGGTPEVVHTSDVRNSIICANRFNIVRTYTATDACGNTATCTQLITVFDDTPPMITCPPSVTVECASEVEAADPGQVVATDNCGGTPTVTHGGDVITSMPCANTFIILRTYIATDSCGNTASCNQSIFVNDDTPPMITCPTNITVACAADVPPADTSSVIVSDNCGGVINVDLVASSISAFVCENRFVVTRTYQATDACGNTSVCDHVIVVNDTIPPVIDTCISDTTVTCASQIPPPNTAELSATDNCGAPVSFTVLTDSTTNDSCVNRFVVLRTYVALDDCGNSSTCVQTITVFDDVPPMITCPTNITVACDDDVPPPATALPVSDNCGGVVDVAMVASSISAFTCENGYVVTRTYQATDACGNTATCDHVIVVNDTIPPVIFCADDLTVSCTEQLPPVDTSSVTVLDNCPGTIDITSNDTVSDSTCTNGYTLTRIYIATDACGNTATCTQIITVSDTISPEIGCPQGFIVSCASEVGDPDTASVVAVDNCIGDPVIAHEGDTIINQTCVNRYTLIRTFSATDECGNSSTCVQVIVVNDIIPPQITCPLDATISNNDDTQPANTGTPTATDNCEGTPEVTFDDFTIAGECPGDYTIQRTWTATDSCNNSATCIQIIDVTGACNVDLSLVKVLDPGQNPISGGDDVNFTITVTNEGLVPVGSITVIDYIPDGFTLNDSDWAAGTEGSTGQSASIVLSTANGALPPGGLIPMASVNVGITLRADLDIAPGEYINIAEIIAVFDTEGNDVTNDDVDSNPDTDDMNDPEAEDDHDPVAICIISDVIIEGNGFVCSGDTATYCVVGFNPEDTYEWILSGGGTIIENSDSCIVVEWTAPPGGPYVITVNQTVGPDCISTGTFEVSIQGGEAIACLDHVNLSIDDECGTIVVSGMILTGEQAGNNNYTVYIIDMNGDTVPNATLTWMHVGQTFKVSVVSECSGQSCWGWLTVEDKLPPQIICTCPVGNEIDSCNITCLELPQFLAGNIPADLAPQVEDNCGGTTLEIVNIALSFETCEGGYVSVEWLATDAAGNTSTCVQEFGITPLTLDSLEFPADYTGDCDDSSDPSVTGWPQVDGIDLTDVPGHCNILATYTDNEFDLCGGGRKIIRTWTVLDWCAPESREFVQFIILADREGPVLTCTPDITVGTNVWYCYANVTVPLPGAIDACSPIKSYQLQSPFGIVVPTGNIYRVNELPVGTHTLRWVVTDECHNTSSCTFSITVIDNVPPVPSCQQHLIVSLTNDRPNGITLVPATAFDDGSEDNCSPVTFRARRMDSCIDIDWTTGGACVDDIPGGIPAISDKDLGTAHGVCVPFACCDVNAGPIMIEVEMTDEAGNVNYCMVEVEVQDKIAPDLTCPPDIFVSCEFVIDVVPGVYKDILGNNDGTLDEDPLSEVFGNMLDGFRHDQSERESIIINDPANEYYIQPFNWGLDGWASDNCEVNLEVIVEVVEDCSGVSFPGQAPDGAVQLITRRFIGRDASGNPSPGSCTQRIWVIDYDPFTITDTTCNNENPFDDIIWPCDVHLNACTELGDTGEPQIFDDHCNIIGVSSEDSYYEISEEGCYKILREWRVIDWCQFNVNTGEGLWRYTQVIKVTDSAGPEFIDCPQGTVSLCLDDPGITLPANNQTVLGENNPNASSCSVHVVMSQEVRELCNTSVTYDVKIYPFNGGEFIQIKPSTVLELDDNHEGVMSFNTQQSSMISIAQNGLPYNDPLCDDAHRVVWTVIDGCGNVSTCDYLFRLEDCKDPTPVCLNGISAMVMPGSGEVTIWASDFNASSVDDCTPSEELLYSFSGTSYQPSFTYTCDNVPAFGEEIEEDIWVADAGVDQNCNGIIEWTERNKDFCTTYIIITDENNVCDENGTVLIGEVMTEHIDAVSKVKVDVTGPNGTLPGYVTESDGKYTISNLQTGLDYTITAQRNDEHKNGVSTLDLVQIQKHLLGKELFSSPYQYIAADANNSGSVSAIDLIEIRKLILGLYTVFPDNESWRFVNKGSQLDADHPWPFDESIFIEGLSENETTPLDFVGVKIGDVNNTVKANANQITPRNNRDVITVHAVTEKELTKGEIVDIRFVVPGTPAGFQWTLETSGLDFFGIRSYDIPMNESNVGVHDNGTITLSWNGAPFKSEENVEEISFIIRFVVTSSGAVMDKIRLTGAITAAEAYTSAGEILDVKLGFGKNDSGLDFALYQNTPNPWNNQTSIGFNLPEDAVATLVVYDVTGRIVKSITGDYKAGYNSIILSTKDLPGPGVLYYKLESAGYAATKKMMITQ